MLNLVCLRNEYDVAISDEIVKSDDLCYNAPHMIVLSPFKAKDLVVPRWIWLPICHLASPRISPTWLIRVL